jgi:general secretion pathway protein G
MKSHEVPRLRHDAGFTLTELLVVLVILSLLAAAITPQVMGRLDRSKVKAARLQIDTLAASLDMFKIDTGRYPSEQEGLHALIEAPASSVSWGGPYVRTGASLTDPWNREFVYRTSGTGFVLITYGADGQEGGDGYAADIRFPDFTSLNTPG